MDKIVMIAAVVAVIIVLGATFLILNGSPATKEQGSSGTSGGTNTADEGGANGGTGDHPVHKPSGNYTNATYGKMLADVPGDCKLYRHVVTDSLACFGRAGNYSTLVTNEYRLSNSTDYFCKPTIYGCKLYQKVTFELP